MLAKRIIPCLDVHDGIVTRGQQFGRVERGELANVGDPVELSLDVMPGRIIKGTVRSVGYGVSDGRNSNPGALPSISPSMGWVREPQRFPVIVALDREEIRGLGRIGGQASVIVFTGRNFFLNAIGRLQIRIATLLSYVR